MFQPSAHDITVLLGKWRSGDESAGEELWPLIYDQLKSLARNVRRGKPYARAGTSTLVHEAYLRLLGSSELAFNDRRHFFAVAARAMRFLLVDEARRRLAAKRDGEEPANTAVRLAVDPASDPARRPPETILAVHEALGRLAKIQPRYEKLVELRYFAGLSIEETAELLDVSRPTVVRDWRAARTWLYGELDTGAGAGA